MCNLRMLPILVLNSRNVILMYSILDLVLCGHMPIYLQGKEEMCQCAGHLQNALTFDNVYA